MKILVVSDIHGNAEALRAIMEKEADADEAIFLGDALLSGPQANETLELLERLDPAVSILGNHDEEVLDPSLFKHWPAEWVALNEWIIRHLDRGVAERLGAFKGNGEYEVGGLALYLHHGELKGSKLKALPDADDEAFRMMGAGRDASLAGAGGDTPLADAGGDAPLADAGGVAPLVLFGHTHVQFERVIDGKRYINPGSVGQPRCGRLQACYGVLEDGDYQPRQVTYDPAPWLAALERVDALQPYPDFRQWLKDGLLTGYGIGRREPWTRYAAQGYC